MLAFMALQLRGDPEHRSIDDGAIVIGQLDDACLDDEPAEFDQMSSALASLDLPGAHVIASLCRLPVIVGCLVALERYPGCFQMLEQFAGIGSRKTSLHASPMPHALRCLSSQ